MEILHNWLNNGKWERIVNNVDLQHLMIRVDSSYQKLICKAIKCERNFIKKPTTELIFDYTTKIHGKCDLDILNVFSKSPLDEYVTEDEARKMSNLDSCIILWNKRMILIKIMVSLRIMGFSSNSSASTFKCDCECQRKKEVLIQWLPKCSLLRKYKHSEKNAIYLCQTAIIVRMA